MRPTASGVSVEGLNTEVERFDEFGYVVLPELIERDRASELWTLIGEMPGHFYPDEVSGLRYVNERTLLRDRRFFDVVTDPTFVGTARQLIGDDVQALDHLAIELPPGRGDARGWHTDFAYTGTPRLVVTANVYLQDLTDDVGPLYCLPGTHHEHRLKDNEFVGDPQPGEVKMNLPAGTAIIFHSNLLHSRSRNCSDRPRRILFHFYGRYWMKRLDEFYREPLPEYVTSHHDPLVRQLFGVELSSDSVHGPSYNPTLYG